jgi:Recombination endonuclease VII
MPDGHINVCRGCRSNYIYEYRGKNRKTLAEKKAANYQSKKEEINSKKRAQRKSEPSRFKEHNLRYGFGLSLEDYNQMLSKQNGVCAICKHPETSKHQGGKIRDLAVDHDHATGKIRGLLCSSCNLGLGKLKDDFEIILQAAKYIQKHKNII